MRVIPLGELSHEWTPELQYLVPVADAQDAQELRQLCTGGLHNLYPLLSESLWETSWQNNAVVGDVTLLEAGDVVVSQPHRNEIQVQYRPSDDHHAIFLTNRCNSYCLMCSQPPTPQDDSWLVGEAIEILRHILPSPAVIGMTGGEPLLLGPKLREVFDITAELHPTSRIDLLTNGRLLANPDCVKQLLGQLRANVCWLVPLYGHADFLHDFVVQSHGAFHETLAGLLNLQSYEQAIQLRIVLIEPVLEILPQLCAFIGRNLPFVREVAIMGCEPIGFALANRAQCEMDLGNWHSELLAGISALDRAGIPCILMNTPLCTLPSALWRYAHRSISDWKRVYVGECEQCLVKDACGGLFAWQEKGWRPGAIVPIREVMTT
ncbi:His-Xaa-Ser system radical SAM maturase HxsC [Chitinimonas viridis]|uniref:His-Xaa-Ser system radical SAM maturase HxsC n=1 Tax=Chitinimonas viridis TaxID=664880 RepID=A0ABT8B3Y1_9NEIS|nr:His-Xaa-Ser system radical SAM maturase HxsC [Chitinimonas viridis]MDN3576694.1 His-Xaa-Ser system radical SAM maturase HxsC [Chitinimonas viridis]